MEGVLEKAAVKRAREAMQKFNLKGEIKVLAESARTAQDAATALGIQVGQIASSLVFKFPDNEPLLVITSGRHRVNLDLVSTLLSVTKFERADADYVKEKSGYSVGGVAPLGWLNPPKKTLIDLALSEYEVVWAAAGHPHTVFPTSFSELVQVSGGEPAVVGD